jgi:hypothetical protein
MANEKETPKLKLADGAAETITLPLADVELMRSAAAEAIELRRKCAALEDGRSVSSGQASELRQALDALTVARKGQADADACNAELMADKERLLRDIASVRVLLDEAKAPQPAGATDELQPGHRRVITIQNYSFDSLGGKKSVGKGVVIQVPEADYQNDLIRRFAHLEDYADHQAKEQKRSRLGNQPAQHASDQLAAILATSDRAIALRKEQRLQLMADLTHPDRIAAQLPPV